MGALALTASLILDRPLVDPEGFLGPSWLRLPLQFPMIRAAWSLAGAER